MLNTQLLIHVLVFAELLLLLFSSSTNSQIPVCLQLSATYSSQGHQGPVVNQKDAGIRSLISGSNMEFVMEPVWASLACGRTAKNQERKPTPASHEQQKCRHPAWNPFIVIVLLCFYLFLSQLWNRIISILVIPSHKITLSFSTVLYKRTGKRRNIYHCWKKDIN